MAAPSPVTHPRRPWRTPTLPLHVAAVALGLVMALRMSVALSRGSRLTNESGIWSALAIDYAHGVLYRPLVGPLGIGGTRYFPVHIMVQGELIRAGMGPITAGFAILLASTAGLLVGMFAVLRQFGVRPGLAWPVVVLATGTGAADYALTSIRGDLLPAALNLFGLACGAVACRAAPSPRRPVAWAAAAGALFAAAFLTKETALYGLAATVAALLVGGRRRYGAAAATVAAFVVVAAPTLAAVDHASRGQFWANLRACASGGDWLLFMAKRLPTSLTDAIVRADPIGCGVLILGGAAVLSAPRSTWTGLPATSLAFTAAATVVLFLSGGIWVNHLIDLDLALLVFTAVVLTATPWVERVATAALAMLAVVATANAMVGLIGDLSYRAADYRATIDQATAPAAGPGPVLTDFSLFPVLRGESPYVLDDFMLGLVGKSHPSILAGLYRQLDRGDFSAVVLKADPTLAARRAVWGDGFVSHLMATYRPAFVHGSFTVYWRRATRPEAATRPASDRP